MDPDLLLSRRIHALRKACGYTLEQLAERSGVSRSMISLIERQQTSPTASVLNKLADALGVSMPALFGGDADPDTAGADTQDAGRRPLARAGDQPVWTDPASGYVRRQLSPLHWGSPLELVEVRFPAGETVVFEHPVRSMVIHQQLALLEGSMDITVGTHTWRLQSGDCLAMELGERIAFHNPARTPARYLLALASFPAPSSRSL